MPPSILLVTILTMTSVAALPDDVAVLRKPARNPSETRAAWNRVVAAGPEALLPILNAWPTDDPVAANWLRSAFDDIAGQNSKKLPVVDLLRFAIDVKNPGKARRLAFSAVDLAAPGTLATRLSTMLNDPEFGPDAVADRIAAAENATDPAEAKRILSAAFNAAIEVEQVRAIAKKLTGHGEKVDPISKLGIVASWRVIGPFPVSTAEGLKQSFPPEIKIDFQAEYSGKVEPLRWKPVVGNLEGVVELVRSGISPENGAVAYAFARIDVPKGMSAELRIGAVDNVTAWVNGKEVIRIASLYRSLLRIDRHRAVVALAPGENTVLLKFTKTPAEDGGRPGAPRWDFLVRLVEANGRGVSFVIPGDDK